MSRLDAHRLASGGQRVLGNHRARGCAAQPLALYPGAAPCPSRFGMVWSVVVAKLPAVGFNFTTDQLFWLAAFPAYRARRCASSIPSWCRSAAAGCGRRSATWSLLIPAFGIGYAVQDPSTPYFIFLVLALLCGFGGGNFASSMANICFFFPKSQKGNALALNAGLGNLGVSVVQFAVPLVITDERVRLARRRACSKIGRLEPSSGCKTPVSSGFRSSSCPRFAAWFGMNDIASASASFAEQAVIFQRKHNWIMCWLYTGTFGSFIGYSAGFPLLARPNSQRSTRCSMSSSGRWSARCRAGYRLALRQMWRRPRHLLGIPAHDRGRWRRALFPWHQGSAGRVLGLLRHVHGAVLRNRRRQRLHFPDDPEHHAPGNGAADAGSVCRPKASSGREGVGCDHRLYLGYCRLWRLLHPQGLRLLDCANRRRHRRLCGASSASTSPACSSLGSSTHARAGFSTTSNAAAH